MFTTQRVRPASPTLTGFEPPDQNGEPFWFPNWTRLVYAGDGLFSSEEDIYNPTRDAPGAVGAWLQAGGKFASNEFLQPKA